MEAASNVEDQEGQLPPPYQPNYGTSSDGPPAYGTSSSTIFGETLGPPPSYDSVFGRVEAAKAQSSGIVDFLKKFFIIILSTIGCTVCVALVLAIPLSMIVIGSLYVHNCPCERYIPIYLIVGGCVGVLKNLSNIVQRVRNRSNDQEDENARTNPFDGTLNCFLFAWFIAGNVWIYRTYGRFNENDPSSPVYCNPTLYYFAFWLTTSMYILIALSCCCVCVTGCFFGALPNTERDESRRRQNP